ncbi:MAG: DUF255 domain-containing protein [Planctomycetes bacterium]|nr:DUF255 domain-containing protein [Planctomycetota bacterium]
MTSIRWIEWGEEAFRRAREEDRPILLTIVASWCRWCKEIDATTFSDAEVVRTIEESYVPVRVDKDRRPDVNERYNAGGWPTIAFLTPDGDLIAGDTFLGAKDLLSLLERVRGFYRENREAIRSRIADVLAKSIRAQERREAFAGSLSPEIPRRVAEAILSKFDPLYGGFGDGQKFAHPEALDFALVWCARTGDEPMAEGVRRTLDHIAGGEIHDRVDGGLFRYAATRDWRVPNTEKVLESNAGPLRSFLEGWQVFGKEEYRAVAAGILRWASATLVDPETGAFFGSQDADPAYYALPVEERRRRGAPPIDRTIYTNWNAMMVSSLLKAHVVLGEERWRETALGTLRFLLEEMYEEGRGMHHYWDGTFHLPGLLTDQAYTVRALVDAVQYTGDNRFLVPATDLARSLVRHQSSPGGGFYDIRSDPLALGGLKRQNRSILENAVVAEAFLRLAYFTREESLRETARRTFEAFTRDYKQYGYYVAGYGRAVDLYFHEPIQVTIVGPRGAEATDRLRRAAFERYLGSRIVQVLDPALDGEILARAGLPARESPVAYLTIGRASYAEVSDPADLPSVLAMGERDRARRE